VSGNAGPTSSPTLGVNCSQWMTHQGRHLSRRPLFHAATVFDARGGSRVLPCRLGNTDAPTAAVSRVDLNSCGGLHPLLHKPITPSHLYPTRALLVRGLVVWWCYDADGGYASVAFQQSYAMVFAFCMCAGVPRKAGRGAPTPCPDTPGVPHLRRGSRPQGDHASEQRARTGVSQFVSDAQSVWPGVRTECPHRRRAPEGWQHP
jgi:hypothetical protein